MFHKILKDEKGGFFVFGPWWFVILVMIIGFVVSILRKNDSKAGVLSRFMIINPFLHWQNMYMDNICPQCGKNNSKSAKFCNGCGGNLIDYPGILSCMWRKKFIKRQILSRMW